MFKILGVSVVRQATVWHGAEPYVTHVESWLQGCCVTGAGPGHAVPVESNEPVDDTQVAERVWVGGGPPETAHVAEQALHSPNWYE